MNELGQMDFDILITKIGKWLQNKENNMNKGLRWDCQSVEVQEKIELNG